MLETRLPLREVALLVAALALGACDGGGDEAEDGNSDAMAPFCESDDRADPFAVDLTKTGELYTVRIVEATPAEPVRGDNTWTVMLTDGSGTPMEGMTVDAKPWMPDHGHGSPVEEQVEALGGGEYRITPLNLFMAGVWEVTLEMTGADDVTDEVVFTVCVD